MSGLRGRIPYYTPETVRCLRPRRYLDPHAPGGVRLERCHTNWCGFCGQQRILETVGAMAMAPLVQAAWVSWPGAIDDLEAVAVQLRRGVRKTVAQLGIAGAWAIELSPGGRPHAHVVTRGRPVQGWVFERACRRGGLGVASIESVQVQPWPTCRYLLKSGIAGHGESIEEARVRLEVFLGLNAGRLVQTQGGFWRDPSGRPLANVVVARKLARRLRLDEREQSGG